MKNKIIDKKDIQFKLTRLAYQILEENYAEKEIELIGIEQKGEDLAKNIKEKIQSIQDLKVNIHTLSMDKKNPLSKEIKISTDLKNLENKSIIIVDDVANTGRTGFYAFKPLLEINAKMVKMAVLVDRRHKKYPVYSDYVGMKLTTTLQEYISVKFEKGTPVGVYLS